MRRRHTPLATLAIMVENIPQNAASVSPVDVSPKNVPRCEINLTMLSGVDCPLCPICDRGRAAAQHVERAQEVMPTSLRAMSGLLESLMAFGVIAHLCVLKPARGARTPRSAVLRELIVAKPLITWSHP